MSERFESLVNGDLIPGLKALPGVRDAQALWPRRLQDNPPDIVCQVTVQFDSVADIDAMLASPQRLELRPRVLAVKALFDGVFSHIDYEVG